jgi:cation:H+ antiporter
MMLFNSLLLIAGIVLLYFGSEWMVKGSASLALSMMIRPIIIGLTIVAFATSAPELLVSIIAAFKGSSGVSIGNILGSNVANIGLVLGLSATTRPLTIDRKLIKREMPYMALVSTLFWILCADGRVGRIDGLILLGAFLLFMIWSIITAKDTPDKEVVLDAAENRGVFLCMAMILAGTAGLMLGANLMVKSAIYLARTFGMSELFIGLSIVAVGTSLPELATSVVAGIKGEHDISVGNVVGSNIFNICLVIGSVGLLNPMDVETRLNMFEFPAMLILSLVLFVLTGTGRRLGRISGILFTISYLFYVGGSYILSR